MGDFIVTFPRIQVLKMTPYDDSITRSVEKRQRTTRQPGYGKAIDFQSGAMLVFFCETVFFIR